jgi:hypothetical protein
MARRFHGRMDIVPAKRGATVAVYFPDIAVAAEPAPVS